MKCKNPNVPLRHEIRALIVVFIDYSEIVEMLNICEGGCDVWIGLHKDVKEAWKYVNIEKSKEEDIHWNPAYPVKTSGHECASMRIQPNGSDHLLSSNFYPCATKLYVMCEYLCR